MELYLNNNKKNGSAIIYVRGKESGLVVTIKQIVTYYKQKHIYSIFAKWEAETIFHFLLLLRIIFAKKESKNIIWLF